MNLFKSEFCLVMLLASDGIQCSYHVSISIFKPVNMVQIRALKLEEGC